MKNILSIIRKMKQFLINNIDNIKTCRCRVGMQAVNGKLIIQLEWPYLIIHLIFEYNLIIKFIIENVKVYVHFL